VESDRHGRTHRLELGDQTLRDWDAVVVAVDPDQGLVLDRSAFYPGGGGQPPDHGVLLWGGVQTRVVGVRKADDLWLVPADGDPVPPVGTAVRGAVEDDRRTALMRTHSGLHLLSGVVFRDFGALVTGGNMEPLEARMDFNLPGVPEGFRDAVAAACAAEIDADRAITTTTLPRERAFADYPDLIRTCSPTTSRSSGSSTSPAWTPRPTPAPTSPPPRRSAAWRSSRSRTRARASGACASGSSECWCECWPG